MPVIIGKERCEMLAEYVVEHNCTVRRAGKAFGISKSTVHKDITAVLKKINPILYRDVKEILEINKAERHLRGGEATKRKYEEKEKSNK